MVCLNVQHAVVALVLLGLFRSSSMAAVKSEDTTLEHDIEDIKDELESLQPRETKSECCNTNQPTTENNALTGEIEALIEDAVVKYNDMMEVLSTEKILLREARRDLLDDTGALEVSVDAVDKKTTALETRLDRAENNILRLLELVAEQQIILDQLPATVERNTKLVKYLSLVIYDKQPQIMELLIEPNQNKTNGAGNQAETLPDSTRIPFEATTMGYTTMQTTGADESEPPISADLPSSCPNKWVRQSNSCMFYSDIDLSWNNAKKYCIRNDGILAEPFTREALSDLTKGFPVAKVRWWIGGSDRREEGTWLWDSSKRPIGDVQWNAGEPNNKGGNEDCTEIVYDSTLNDRKCGKKARFVCEIKL